MTEPLTHHGGRLGDARARFGGAAGDWLDLSTGINPISWQPSDEAVIDWRALPDPRELARLERTAAAYFGVDPALCLAVPGSEAVLRGLGHILQLPGRHLPLCYSTHAQAFAQARPIAGSDAPDAGPSVLVLGNPNNPDGALMPREAVLATLARQESSGGWLIVDEAFADCAPDASVADQVSDERQLIVTRSFGKFFGLAGVRLGFVLGPAALLAQVRRLQGDWPVCAAALAFGIEAYADAKWIAATRMGLAAAASQLDQVLLRHGLKTRGSCPMFRLVETATARDLFVALASRHILTRPFADHPHLLRFGLPGTPAALARLDAELASVRRDG
jgi:cobalamin biosynthetic protein CobC